MGIVDKVRGLGFGIIIWTLAVPIFLFTIFPLVSSTSAGTSGIYLISIAYNMKDDIWLRVGYYGLCFVEKNKSLCTSTSGQTAKSIAKRWNIDSSYITYPMKLQKDVFVAFLTAGGIVWVVSLVLITLVILRGSSSGRLIRSIAKVTALASATLMIASAWATNSAARALEVTADSSSLKGGVLLYGLQWVGAILAFFYTWAVTHVADSEDAGKSSSYYLGRGGV